MSVVQLSHRTGQAARTSKASKGSGLSHNSFIPTLSSEQLDGSTRPMQLGVVVVVVVVVVDVDVIVVVVVVVVVVVDLGQVRHFPGHSRFRRSVTGSKTTASWLSPPAHAVNSTSLHAGGSSIPLHCIGHVLHKIGHCCRTVGSLQAVGRPPSRIPPTDGRNVYL